MLPDKSIPVKPDDFEPGHVQRTQMAAVVYKQAVQRALSIGTTDIKVTERGAVVQVQRLQNGMAHVSQVKFKDTAGAVEVLGIVHDKVGVKSKLDRRTRVFGKNRTLMRGPAGIAVTEIIRSLDLILT